MKALDLQDNSMALAVTASNVATITSALLAACPQPRRQDMHKILAIQAYWLNEHGLALLSLSKGEDVKNKRAIVEAGVRLVSESRKTMATLLGDPSFDRGAPGATPAPATAHAGDPVV